MQFGYYTMEKYKGPPDQYYVQYTWILTWGVVQQWFSFFFPFSSQCISTKRLCVQSCSMLVIVNLK